MPATLKQVRKLEGERVRMLFDDGREEVAVLLCATKDIDGSEHLIYERFHTEQSHEFEGEQTVVPSRCVYAKARSLLSIERVPEAPRFLNPKLPELPEVELLRTACMSGCAGGGS